MMSKYLINSKKSGWNALYLKSSGLLGLTVFLLSGCLAPSIQPSAQQIAGLQTILVVPVEAPPLEIIPDPIEERLPVYRHYRNMVIPVPLQETIYKNPGNVLIAGQISSDDIVTELLMDRNQVSNQLESTDSLKEYWVPTLILAESTVSRLNGLKAKASASDHYYRLPMAKRDRNAYLSNWRQAVSKWYSQDRSPVDYHQAANESGIDAVLEVGINKYRIFEGQVSLQVLARLIDPRSGRLIARTQEADYTVAGSAQALLDNDSSQFKQLITDMGNRLIKQALNRIGFSSGVLMQQEVAALGSAARGESF